MSIRPQAIVALDVGSLDDARAVVTRLGDRADFYKVGLQLFSAAGPPAVEWLHAEGKKVFLDLKLHDIPRTVLRSAEAARRMGVALLTVHGLGGAGMVRAAVEAAGEKTGVLVVTVLTSLDRAGASAALGRQLVTVEDEVLRLAALAYDARAHGVVCAGVESGAVRTRFGAALQTLVPGIRAADAAPDDQARVVTAAAAARAGAAYVVVGRAVTAAPDPVAAYERVLAELA
jgi:orotidine-5'-phosphate decarboxylase